MPIFWNCSNYDDADRNGNNNIIMTMTIINSGNNNEPKPCVCRRPGGDGGKDGRLSSPRLVYYILHYYYYHGYIHERNSGAHSIRRRHPFEIAATRRSPRPFFAHRRQCAGYARRLLMTVVRCAVRFNRRPTICGIDVYVISCFFRFDVLFYYFVLTDAVASVEYLASQTKTIQQQQQQQQ